MIFRKGHPYIPDVHAHGVHFTADYLARCERALAEALTQVVAYHSWRGGGAGAGGDIFSRLAALPILDKHELRSFGPAGFVPGGRDLQAGLANGEIELVHTSGTTGDRVVNVWHQPWWDRSETASWKLNSHCRNLAHGQPREAILTSPWCAGYPCEDGYLPMAQRRLDRFLFLSERSDPSRWEAFLMDRMVEEMDEFQPTLLEANPSFLAVLALHAVCHRRPSHQPAMIFLTYEYPSVLHRRHIRRAFTAPVASSYGSTEAGYVFMECEAGRLHQNTECCHVDFIPFKEEHGGPAIGSILVTTFDHPWRSLVRFNIGDVVRLADSPCPCGRSDGLTLETIEGRLVNLTTTTDGRAVTQGQVDRAISAIAGVLQYQVLQTSPCDYELRVVGEGGHATSLRDTAQAALHDIYGSGAHVQVELVKAIPPDPPGKYRLTKRTQPIDVATLWEPLFAPPVGYGGRDSVEPHGFVGRTR